MTFEETFGIWLRATRKMQKVSQGALGTRIGVHRNTIMRWEKGQADIAFPDLVQVCGALGFDVCIERKAAA